MNEKMKSKIIGLVTFLVVAVIFVGPRIMNDNAPSAATVSEIEAIRSKIGDGRFSGIMNGTLPLGYMAICMKEHGESKELLSAVEKFNTRNESKMISVLQSIEAAGGLSADEKTAIDKYAYARAVGDLRRGNVSCENLNNRINRGDWDL